MKPARETDRVDLTMGSIVANPPLEQDILQIQKDVKLDVNSTCVKQEEATATDNSKEVSVGAMALEPAEKLPPGPHKLAEVPPHSGNTQQDSNSADSVVAPNAVGPPTALCIKPTRKLFGLEKQREKLHKMLGGTDVSTKGQPKVVLIVGSGGLGKTALAEAVYTELKPKIFEGSRAFISVGAGPDMKNIFVNVLHQIQVMEVHDDDLLLSDKEKAREHLQKYLSRARYFIVFDNICDQETWDEVQRALPTNSEYGSIVLVTTRNTALSGNLDGNNVLVLEELSDDQSKELFYRETFGVTEECLEKVHKEHLARVSEKIDRSLRQCNGVPLAILTMASQMACIPMSEWSGHDIFQTDPKTNMNIKHHDHLPLHLKDCVLYLSNLPAADHWIEKDGLIWKWIAEDLVQSTDDGKGLFEVGEGYFNMLIERRMIQPVNRYDKGSLREGCRVHNVILHQIHYLLSSENISRVRGVERRMPSGRKAHPLLCIEGEISWKQIIRSYRIQEKWSSLCAYRCDHIDRFMPSNAFRNLRVLDLVCCCFQTMNIYMLCEGQLNLKYLGLAGTHIFPISALIITGKMSSLQTLDLRRTGIENLVTTEAQLSELLCLEKVSAIVVKKIEKVCDIVVKVLDIVGKIIDKVSELRGLEKKPSGLAKAEGEPSGSEKTEGERSGSEKAEGQRSGSEKAEGKLSSSEKAEGKLSGSGKTEGKLSSSGKTEGDPSGSNEDDTPIELQCLWCDDTTRFQDGFIKNLTSLQDLQVHFKSPKLVQELSRLTELRVLRIGLDDLSGDKQVGILRDSLADLKKLTCLEIRCTSLTRRDTVSSDLIAPCHLRSLSLEGICFPSLPEWITPSRAPHLSRLAFAVEDLKVSDLSNLRGLPELTCLNMVAGNHPPDGEQVRSHGGRRAFEKLRFCTTNVPPSRFLQSPGAASLPSLEVLQFVVKVKDAPAEFDLVFGLHHLDHVTILLDCWGASDSEAEAMEKEAALRLAANKANNRNHPATEVIKDKQGAKLQVPLSSENMGSYPRGSEMAKMRTNQENLRKIQLHKELSRLDTRLKDLQAQVMD